MRRDYYAVLGIAATAGPREIRQAYRRLARQYSPDVNFWDERARALFEEIAEAYRVLSDPGARAHVRPFGAAAGAAEALARGAAATTCTSRSSLAFADAARGVEPQVDVARFSPCRGVRRAGRRRPAGPCASCAGRGVRRGSERGGRRIPAGVDTGSQVRVAGRGSTRARSAAARRSRRQHAGARASVLRPQGRQRALRGRRSACGRRCVARACGCPRRRARPCS